MQHAERALANNGKLIAGGAKNNVHEWSSSSSECGWAGRGLLALLPTGPRENSWPWPGDLAASAHTFACPASRNRCLIICPSQGPSWERRPIMGALKSPPNWRRLRLSGQVCTYPWRCPPFPACHSWEEAGPVSTYLQWVSSIFNWVATTTLPRVSRNEKLKPFQ